MNEYGNITGRLTEGIEFSENKVGTRQQQKTFSYKGIVMCI